MASRYVCVMKVPEIVTTAAALRGRIADWRHGGARVGLVPTMGALHDGHLSLVRETQSRTDKVVASIFVNPAQFAPHEDFDRYPRGLQSDAAKLGSVGLDLIFAPSVAEMYPAGFATAIQIGGPSTGLETDFRPHFFSGVATVVAKLFTQCRPDCVMFGEKDYQQLQTVIRMAADLDLRVKVVGVPTVREKDGLAMSSRNAYLDHKERAIAPTLYRVLRECAARIAAGEAIAQVMAEGWIEIEAAGFAVDYLEARDAETLARAETLGDGPLRLLAAARLGKTRLIDNLGV